MEKISVLITDDHVLFREGFLRSLKYNKSIGNVLLAGSGNEAIQLLQKNKVDIVFMDLMMKEMNGLEATKTILLQFPDQKVIILSQFDDEENIKRTIAAGARGYLTKTSDIVEINTAIKAVLKGGVFYSKEALSSMVAKKRQDPNLPLIVVQLTNREISIIELICKGFADKDIALKTGISKRTIEWHKRNLFKKANVRSPAGLINFAIINGYHKV
jgi:DNA-binding NarL/FixJ family response regulator